MIMHFTWKHFRRWAVFFLHIYNLDVSSVLAVQNVTVDDPNLSIVYSPVKSWQISQGSPLDFGPGGAHHLTSDSSATASFNFTGIAIYFFAPLWPYAVGVDITLDSEPSVLVPLIDTSRPTSDGGSETVPSQVVWSATGLANTTHNLLVSFAAGYQFAIVDGLIYTTDNVTNSSLSSSSVSPPSVSSTSTAIASSSSSQVASSTSTSAPHASSATVLTIAFASLFGSLVLLIVSFSLCYLFRRPKKSNKRWTIEGSSGHTPSSSINSMTALQPNAMNNGTWTVNSFHGTNSYVPVSQLESNNEIWHEPHRDEDVGIPLLPVASHHGGDQDGIGSSAITHQSQITGLTPVHYGPSHAIPEKLTVTLQMSNPLEDPPPSYHPNSGP